MKSYLLILISILLGAAGQVAMKWGTMQSASVEGLGVLKVLLKYFTSLPILAGLCCYGLSAVIWIFAIAKVDLSYAYPMVALSYVIVFACSYFLLGEPISILRLAGLLTIIAGVIMIAKS